MQSISRRLSTRVLIFLVLLAVAVSMTYPLATTLLSSFMTLADYQANGPMWPSPWTLENYTTAWEQGHIASYAVNSVIVTGLALAISVLVVVPAGYALGQLEVPFRRAVLLGILSFGILSAGLQLVPLTKLMRSPVLAQLGIGSGSYLGLALVYAAFFLPFAIYLMASYFEGLPKPMFESATIDGAGALRAFLLIAVPLARPGVLTMLTFGFLSFWNDYLFALILMPGDDVRTLPVGVALLENQDYTSQPLVSAGVVITMVPCLLIFLVLIRNLNEGLTVGAVKS